MPQPLRTIRSIWRKLGVGHFQSAQFRRSLFAGEPSSQGVAHRVRLLEDLLEHVVRKRALVHVLGLELDLADLEAGVGAGESANIETIRPDGNDLVVVEIDGLARVRDDRGDVAGKEMLALSDAEHERTAAPRADEHAGHIRVNDSDAVGADDLPQRFADRLDERGLSFLLPAVEGHPDQVGEDLGVGLGLENMASFFELRPKRQVVFDHAIVHEDEAPALVEVGMRILVGYAAVRRPARMADSEMAMRRTVRNDLCQIGDASDGLPHFDASAIDGGNARRIIAAVFQAPQAVQEDRNRVCPADITNDAAHRILNRDNSGKAEQDSIPAYESASPDPPCQSYSRNHHGRRSRHPALPSDKRAGQARGAARR